MDEVKKRVESSSDWEDEDLEEDEDTEDMESGIDMMFDLAKPLPSSQRTPGVLCAEKRKMTLPLTSVGATAAAPPATPCLSPSSAKKRALVVEPEMIKAPRLSETERFRWVKKNREDEVVDKSKKWFMKLSNCITHARRFAQIMLDDGAFFLDFDTETVKVYPVDLIEKVFLYFLKSEYTAKMSVECAGCDPTDLEFGEHNMACLKHGDCLIDGPLVKKALLKIPAARIHAGVIEICNLFKVPEEDLSLIVVQNFLSRKVSQDTLNKMIKGLDFEKEVEDKLKEW